MKPEAQHIQETLVQYQEAISALPSQYAAAKRDTDRKIDLLCEEAGIMGKVEELRTQLEATTKKIQSRADVMSGHSQALKDIYQKYHLAPIPEGITHMYGIELEPLDPETRLRVMHGQDGPGWHETIDVLNGDATRKEWDGTPDETEEEEEDLVVEPEKPTRLIPPSASWNTEEEEEAEEDEDEEEDEEDEEDEDEDTGDHDPNLDAIRNMMS